MNNSKPKSTRKFYKTIIQVEVISEEPYNFNGNLDNVNYDIVQGDCSGIATVISTEEIDGVTAAKMLLNQGSDPELFQLTEDGEDLEE